MADTKVTEEHIETVMCLIARCTECMGESIMEDDSHSCMSMHMSNLNEEGWVVRDGELLCKECK